MTGGSMSYLLSARYTVVALFLASRSQVTVCHVSNMYTNLKVTILKFLNTKSIINIFTANRIYRHDQCSPQILSRRHFFWIREPS